MYKPKMSQTPHSFSPQSLLTMRPITFTHLSFAWQQEVKNPDDGSSRCKVVNPVLPRQGVGYETSVTGIL
jgi:hypothetical protein